MKITFDCMLTQLRFHKNCLYPAAHQANFFFLVNTWNQSIQYDSY